MPATKRRAGTSTARSTRARPRLARKVRDVYPAARRAARQFIDQYRSYVINYNLGKDMVRAHIEGRADPGNAKRWEEFAALFRHRACRQDLTRRSR